MAHGTAVKMRLWEFLGKCASNGAQAAAYKVAQEMHAMGYRGIQVIQLDFQIATAGTSFAEIGAPNAVFDGTSTAAVVFIDSSSADDAAAGAGATEITLIAQDGTTGKLKNFEKAPTGTTGVSTVSTWKRVLHAFVSAGVDAAGDIYIQDDIGGSNKFLKITNGAVESEGSLIRVPSGYGVKVVIDHITKLGALTAITDLAQIKMTFAGFDNNIDPDNDYEIFEISQQKPAIENLVLNRTWVSHSDDASIKVESLHVGNAVTPLVRISYVLFQQNGGIP